MRVREAVDLFGRPHRLILGLGFGGFLLGHGQGVGVVSAGGSAGVAAGAGGMGFSWRGVWEFVAELAEIDALLPRWRRVAAILPLVGGG